MVTEKEKGKVNEKTEMRRNKRSEKKGRMNNFETRKK